MTRGPVNPNAAKALEEMKLEIANELGLTDSFKTLSAMENAFTAGPVGGQITRNLVEMGQKQLINKNNSSLKR